MHAPEGGCGHKGFPSYTAPWWHQAFPTIFPATGARLLFAQAGEKEAFVAGGNRHPKGRPLANTQGQEKFPSGR